VPISPSFLRSGEFARGFTLVELISVIALIALAGAIALPKLAGASTGLNLKGAAAEVVSQFDIARRTAVSGNLPTEVRIYKDKGQWRTVAVVLPKEVSGQEADQWITPGKAFMGDIVIDPSYSTLKEETAPATAVEADEAPAPRALRGLTYYAFRFMPGGGTNLSLSADQTWVMTLKWQHAPAARSGDGPADNYISVIIDPRTGHTTLLQP